MIVGDKSLLAIQSTISRAYARLSILAIGSFVVHVNGRQYGRSTPDATALALSYHGVLRRLKQRGGHSAPFSDFPARTVARAFREACYADQARSELLGMRTDELRSWFDRKRENSLVWAPDGDEAFDDGSYILQFDTGRSVRVIAFRSRPGKASSYVNIADLEDLSLPEAHFYSVLQEWVDLFDRELSGLPKHSE